MEEKTEGILLQAIPYLGAQKILKVFTPDAGLISLMAKKPSLSAVTNPFLLAEWVYKSGREDLHLLKDATLLNDLSPLRQNYATISAAGQMAKDLLRSQLPAKKQSDLYALTLVYFAKLPTFDRPEVLASSFRLKLLLHEGLLSIQAQCAQCNSPAFKLSEGESVCAAHSGGHTFSYTPEEWDAILTCATARRFSLLQEQAVSINLQEKIGFLFEERMR